MPRRALPWIAVLIASFRIAQAQAPEPPAQSPAPESPTPASPAPPADPASSASPRAAGGPTIVTGRVTDVLGRPVVDARVYVLPRVGEPHQVKTDRGGRYAVDVKTEGTHGVVIAIDRAHTFRTLIVRRGSTNTLDIDVELDVEGGEVIKIEDKKRPIPHVAPKPAFDVQRSMPYSEEAVERDAWARAWLLLDVDVHGAVTRIKLLKRPGFDLDKIAIEEAFKLRFEPARDAQGRPMSTYVLWTMEWPSWGWLVQGNGTAVRKPADDHALHAQAQNIRYVTGHEKVNVGGDVQSHAVGGPWSRPLAAATAFQGALSRVPCAGSGPLNLDLRNRAYRDCSQPDMTVAEALPWITRETAPTAIAELARPRLELVEVPTNHSRVPEIVAFSMTGALAIGTAYAFSRYQKYSRRLDDYSWQLTVDPEAYQEHVDRRARWAKTSLVMSGAFVVSAGISLFLYNRNQPRSSFSVQPTGDGAAAAYTRSF